MRRNLNVIVFFLGFFAANLNWSQTNALNFDGIEDYVQWGDPEQGFPGPYAITPIVEPLVGSDFTIELWMKSDFALWPGPHGVLWAYNSYNPVTHGSNRLILGINTSGQLYIHDGVNNGLSYLRWTGTTIVADGECHHIAFTHDASAKITNVYVDGAVEGGSIATTFILGATDVFNLGQEWDDLDGEHPAEPHQTSQHYFGDLDDIRIWTEERSIGEIADNQYTDFLPGEPNLLAHFKCDQGIASGDNTGVLLLENSTLFPDLDGDLEEFERVSTTSNFVVDECDPCFEDVEAGEDLIICEGEEVTLTASGGGLGVVYSWTDGVLDGVPFAPVVTTTYILTGTGVGGCENLDSVTVTVNPLPTIGAGLDISVCEGEEVILSGTGAGVGGTYDWTGGITDGEAFMAMATETYTVTGTDANGCENTDDVTITVHPLPLIDAGLDVSFCEGEEIEEVTLTATGAGVGGTYNWTGGITDGEPFIPVATETYTVTGTDANGCENTDDVTVSLSSLPIVDAGLDVVVCEGDELILSGSGTAITFDWTGGVIDGEPFIPVGDESYTVTGTDANGCVNTDEVLVTIAPLPNVAFSGVELMGCNPHPVSFTTDTPGASFSWQFGDGDVSSVEDPSHTYTTNGVFDVTLTVTSADGCTGTLTRYDYITVVPKPIAEFTFITNDLIGGEPSAQFNNHSLFSDSYSWNFGDGSPTTDVENPYHEFSGVNESGYYVELKAFNSLGCSDLIAKLVKIDEVLIYYIPNTFTPDGDLFNERFQPVFISGFDIYDFHMMIFNRWGELIFESYDAGYGWNGAYGDNGLVQDGVYIWAIEFGDASTDKRYSELGHVNILK